MRPDICSLSISPFALHLNEPIDTVEYQASLQSSPMELFCRQHRLEWRVRSVIYGVILYPLYQCIFIVAFRSGHRFVTLACIKQLFPEEHYSSKQLDIPPTIQDSHLLPWHLFQMKLIPRNNRSQMKPSTEQSSKARSSNVVYWVRCVKCSLPWDPIDYCNQAFPTQRFTQRSQSTRVNRKASAWMVKLVKFRLCTFGFSNPRIDKFMKIVAVKIRCVPDVE